MKKILLISILIFGLPLLLLAQEEENPQDTTETASDTVRRTFQFLDGAPVTIDLDTEEEEEEEEEDDKKKEKKKRNFYYGKKTRKNYTLSGYGNNVTRELFNYLKKEYVEPDPYVRDFYWYDFKRKEIRSTKNADPKFAGILHGPYEKLKDDQVIEKGMFWNGLKHGRWMRYDNNGILMDKLTYFKGWPIDSKITYYDEEKREQVKEVIPIEHGEREGTYLYFHKNGAVAVQGEYRFDQKVGLWVEYYDLRRRRKKTIQYGRDPFDKDFKPYINQEWNSEGKLVYDRDQWKRKFASK
ncbi:MAG: toxin-antitoxin system YwqK family antitoxin [Bacteroidota bacterium]